MKKILFIILIVSFNKIINSQEYIHPLDINMLLSGTFGELRTNHFHAGIDIKTKGVEGQNVYAIADGYISRIKISSWGYGKVIYINHYDGKTSVYAHLKSFAEKIDTIIKREQYKKEKFEINYYPKKKILIKQKEIIGKSGNTGSSAGAHLHFEIRETKSSRPINPLFFNFKIADNIPPTIKKIKVYNIKNNQDTVINVTKEGSGYLIKDTIQVSQDFSIGISTYDKLNNAYNKNGVYSIKLYYDNNLCYHFQADTLNFLTTRFINAHIDYCEKITNNTKYHRCFSLPYNKLENYKILLNNGVININDEKIHLIELKVNDFANNESSIKFNVKKKIEQINHNIEDTNLELFHYNKNNIFKKDNFKIQIEKMSLYENINFSYSTEDSIKGVFGKIHKCHNNKTPLHKSFTVAIKENIPENLKGKVYIAIKEKDNFYYKGGQWEGKYLTTKIQEFGKMCIIADTIKPDIKGVNIYPGKIIKKQKTIRFTITDKHSGIANYKGTINNKWILMDYDHKRNLLSYDINKLIKKGENNIILEVTDNVGNKKLYEAKFFL